MKIDEFAELGQIHAGGSSVAAGEQTQEATT